MIAGSNVDEGNQSNVDSVPSAAWVAASFVAPPQAEGDDASNTENVDAALQQSQVW